MAFSDRTWIARKKNSAAPIISKEAYFLIVFSSFNAFSGFLNGQVSTWNPFEANSTTVGSGRSLCQSQIVTSLGIQFSN